MEQRIDASEYVDGCFGTADMVIITDKVAHVIDLKLGKGVEVHAEEDVYKRQVAGRAGQRYRGNV